MTFRRRGRQSRERRSPAFLELGADGPVEEDDLPGASRSVLVSILRREHRRLR
jgi:hypothetical protein